MTLDCYVGIRSYTFSCPSVLCKVYKSKVKIIRPTVVNDTRNFHEVSVNHSNSKFLTGQSADGPPEAAKPKKIWSEHKTEAGKVYFYNSVTKQSVWERPKEMDEQQSDDKKTTETDDQPAGANAAKIRKKVCLFQHTSVIFNISTLAHPRGAKLSRYYVLKLEIFYQTL